jgi:hypothetical protein
MKKFIRWLIEWLEWFVIPSQQELVSHLVLHTSCLEMMKHEYTLLAPVKGCCGPFKLSGNALPVLEYIVFHKPIMEFIQVRVEVGRPDKMKFICTISSDSAPERHGEAIETREAFERPFRILIAHLFRYFPLYIKEPKRTDHVQISETPRAI